MQLEISQHTYEDTQSGLKWDMKIGYDGNPVGRDSDTEIHLVRVLGSEGDEFTFKVRFTETSMATERLGLGHVTEDIDKRRSMAIDKACQLIIDGYGEDKIVTMGSDGKWTIENPEHPLLKYSHGG